MRLQIVLAALTGQLETDMKRAERIVNKRSKEMEKTAAERGKKIGAALGAAIVAGVAAAGVALTAVIRNTIEAERVSAQLDAALRSTGRTAPGAAAAIKAFSSELQAVSTFGDEAITAAQSLLLTFTQIGGDTFPRATKAILDMSTAMGKDLAASTQQVGKALNDPIRGVSALSEAGVQFSDEQRELIKTLVETGEVAKAQEIILKELETQFGGSAEAARNTLGGAIEALKNSFGDLLEGSGGNLTGVTQAINDLVDTLNDPGVKAGFAEIVSGMLAVAESAARAASTLGELLRAARETFAAEGLFADDFFSFDSGAIAQMERNRRMVTPDEFITGGGPSAAAAVAAGVTRGAAPTGGGNSAAARNAAADAAKRQAEAERELARAVQAEAKAMEEARRRQIQVEYKLSVALEREAEAREYALQQGRDLISGLQFELELMKMTNAERATAIQLRGMDAEAVALYGDEIARLNEQIEANIKVSEQMDGLRQATSNLFEDLISGTVSAKDAFRSFVDDILANITRMIANNFAQSLFGGMGQMGGGQFGGFAQSLFGGLFGGGLAGGGPVSGGTPYLVGENGPELFIPQASGRIANNAEVRGMGKGGTTINISVEGQVDMRSRQQLAADVGRASQKSLARTY